MSDLFELVPTHNLGDFFKNISPFCVANKIPCRENKAYLKMGVLVLKRLSSLLHKSVKGDILFLLAQIYEVDDRSGRNRKSNTWEPHFITDEVETDLEIVDAVQWRAMRSFLNNMWIAKTSSDVHKMFHSLQSMLTILTKAKKERWNPLLALYPSLLDSPCGLKDLVTHTGLSRLIIFHIAALSLGYSATLHAKEEDSYALSKEEKAKLRGIEQMAEGLGRAHDVQQQGKPYLTLLRDFMDQERQWIEWKNTDFNPLVTPTQVTQQKENNSEVIDTAFGTTKIYLKSLMESSKLENWTSMSPKVTSSAT